MTKLELLAQLAEDAGLTKAQANQVLDSIITQTTNSLKTEGRFTLAGLGTFDVTKREKRSARNPRTGETIEIPARNAIRFRPARGLKDSVN